MMTLYLKLIVVKAMMHVIFLASTNPMLVRAMATNRRICVTLNLNLGIRPIDDPVLLGNDARPCRYLVNTKVELLHVCCVLLVAIDILVREILSSQKNKQFFARCGDSLATQPCGALQDPRMCNLMEAAGECSRGSGSSRCVEQRHVTY